MAITNDKKYDKFAIALHWLIALAIILQLISGIWMTDAIKDEETQAIAYNIYQYHKSLGLLVLVLSLIRLSWRLTHKAPALPQHMKKYEKFAAEAAHKILYLFMIIVPLSGWAVVSTSSYNLPTIFFGLFEWPHISFLAEAVNKADLSDFFEESHGILAFSMLGLITLHIFAALKHQIFDKDNIIQRILP